VRQDARGSGEHGLVSHLASATCSSPLCHQPPGTCQLRRRGDEHKLVQPRRACEQPCSTPARPRRTRRNRSWDRNRSLRVHQLPFRRGAPHIFFFSLAVPVPTTGFTSLPWLALGCSCLFPSLSELDIDASPSRPINFVEGIIEPIG
jgi:hypothetical protein